LPKVHNLYVTTVGSTLLQNP